MERHNRSEQTNRLLTYREVAEVLRVSRRTVQGLVSGGRLPSLRVGPRGVRVLESDLDAFIRDARAREQR